MLRLRKRVDFAMKTDIFNIFFEQNRTDRQRCMTAATKQQIAASIVVLTAIYVEFILVFVEYFDRKVELFHLLSNLFHLLKVGILDIVLRI